MNFAARHFLLLLLLLSCRKDDSDVVLALPPTTQTGANTFGFLLDGKPWTNYGQVCQPNGGACRENLSGAYFTSDGGLLIKADQVIYKDGVAQTQYVEFELLTGLAGVKSYSAAAGDPITFYYMPVGYTPGYDVNDVSPEFSVTLTKLDTSERIMAGTFSGKLYRRLANGTFTSEFVTVTEGRFDIRYP